MEVGKLNSHNHCQKSTKQNSLLKLSQVYFYHLLALYHAKYKIDPICHMLYVL
jgi:hypothetical protein